MKTEYADTLKLLIYSTGEKKKMWGQLSCLKFFEMENRRN